MELTSFAILAAITFAGAVMAAAFGIGFAILAAPLFLVVMDSTGAIPVLAVLNLAASVLVAARIWRQAPVRLLALLCAGSVCGFPIGLALFGRADVSDLKLVAGAVIMLFTLLLLARERGYIGFGRRGTGADRAPIALFVGALAGAMGAALAMPGPIVMIYFVVLRLTKDQSRALSLAFFSFVYTVVCVLHVWDGGLDAPRLWLSAKLMAAVVAGTVAGHWLAQHLSEARFRELLLVILFVAGLAAVASV